MRRPPSQARVAAVVATTVGVWLAQAAHAAPDRYGPPAPADASDAAQPAPQAQPTTYIYWPGKPTAAAPAAPAPAAWAPPAAAVARPTSLYAPPPPRRAPVAVAAPQDNPASAPAPWMTQAAAPATQAPPAAQVPDAPLPPRFYSVQRQYGASATAQLSPQFFADAGAPDLAAPPPPPAPPLLAGQAATSSTTAAIRQRQADEASPDDANAGAPQ